LIAGGLTPNVFNYEVSSRATLLFDPIASSWATCGELAQVRKYHALVALPDGRAVVLGGWNGRDGELDTIEIFDLDTQQWLLAGVMLQKRKQLAAALLPDGRVLITGGSVNEPGSVSVFYSSEIWDPITGFSTAGPTMRSPRYAHDLLTLSTGNILAVGGTLDKGAPAELLSIT
jgi:hypothetical protein